MTEKIAKGDQKAGAKYETEVSRQREDQLFSARCFRRDYARIRLL